MHRLLVLTLLACGSPTVVVPKQTLCNSGQSTADWMIDRVSTQGVQGFVSSLPIDTPVLFCERDGTQTAATLKYIRFDTLELKDNKIWKRHPLQEHGRELFSNRRAFGESVDITSHSPPISVRLEFVRMR